MGIQLFMDFANDRLLSRFPWLNLTTRKLPAACKISIAALRCQNDRLFTCSFIVFYNCSNYFDRFHSKLVVNPIHAMPTCPRDFAHLRLNRLGAFTRRITISPIVDTKPEAGQIANRGRQRRLASGKPSDKRRPSLCLEQLTEHLLGRVEEFSHYAEMLRGSIIHLFDTFACQFKQTNPREYHNHGRMRGDNELRTIVHQAFYLRILKSYGLKTENITE